MQVHTKQLKMDTVNKNVKFVEPVPSILARKYINASDFCLLPAKQVRLSPGSPIKLYDYISCGKPIIAQSNLLGYSDEVENYDLGYLVDFTKPEEAAFELERILKLKKDFSIHNRKMAVEKLSWENRIQDWVKFAKEIESN